MDSEESGGGGYCFRCRSIVSPSCSQVINIIRVAITNRGPIHFMFVSRPSYRSHTGAEAGPLTKTKKKNMQKKSAQGAHGEHG